MNSGRQNCEKACRLIRSDGSFELIHKADSKPLGRELSANAFAGEDL